MFPTSRNRTQRGRVDDHQHRREELGAGNFTVGLKTRLVRAHAVGNNPFAKAEGAMNKGCKSVRTRTIEITESVRGIPPGARTCRVPDACAYLGVGRSFLYERIKAGEIRTFKKQGARLIEVASLDAYLEAPAREIPVAEPPASIADQ